MKAFTLLIISLMLLSAYAGDNYVHTFAVEWPGSNNY
jgi:hypothetical protein